MKRKLWVLFATIVAAVALAFGISACSPFVQLPTQPQPLGTPVVSISDEGIASWEPVVHAVGYSYLIDDAAEVSTTARNVQLEDGQTIQVKATGDGSLYLDSAFSTPATYHKEPVPQLTQLATPVVSIDAEGLATWEAVPNASGYQYKLNGGEEKTLESDAELQVQLQDKDSIQVKAVGDGETYSDSEYSEAKAYTAPVKPQIIKIETPVVTIDGDGTAHWEAVAHASAYFYKIDGEDEIRTTKMSTKLQDGQTISVKACTEEEGYEDSDYSEPVKYTAPVTPPQPTQLATPEVTIDEEGLATWTEVAHASGYKYKINGGEETTLVGAELQVQLEDKQYIEVKAVGDGETYSDSPYSAAKTYNAPAKPEPTQLATPEVTINEAGLATWTEVAHASGYKYKINGGEEKTLVGAELQVQLEDKQYIEVKAVGDGETYSDSPYSAAKTYNAPVKPEPTQLATPEVTIDEDGLATWERVENATGYVCKVGGEEQEVQTELSIQLQSGDTLQVKAVSTDTEHFTESAYSDLQTYTKQPVEEKEKLLATFTLGDDNEENKEGTGQNGDTRGDGDASSSTTVTLHDTQNKYTLTLTDGTNLYQKAWDNAGNGCLRLGSSKNVGKFTFIVPEGITKVVIYVAGYKSESTAVAYTINEKSSGTITVSKHSATPEYEAIEISITGTTEAERTLTFTTVKDVTGTKPRCKINTIEFWGEAVPELTKLDAPTLNVDKHTGDVTWEKVAGATSYTYTIDGENETTVGKDDELKVTLKNNQTISVIAKGDGTTYADSDPATKQYVHEHAYKTENNGWENNSDEGHYKKCTYCQEETEKTGHTYENGACTECQYAHTDHKYSEEKPGECTVCHLKHTEHTYVDRNGKCHTCFAEHTGDDHVLATKTSSTHHWTECEVCGAKTAEIAHTHNTYGSDEIQHWSVCECGATVPDTTEDHTYRNQNGKCDTCEKEHANHDYGKSYISDDASGHHQVCTVCGNVSETVAHSTLQYTHDDDQHWQECPDCHWISGTKEGHTYNNEDQPDHCDKCGFDRKHVHQYTAWDSDDTYHWRYCPYHGDNKNFTDPGTKTLHQYDAAKGDGICTEENCKHAHTGHTFEQKHDQDNHWQECTTCYLKQSITAHSYDWKVSGEQHIHACTCGYQDVEGHTPNMQYVTTDPSYHWEKCEEEGCTITTENEKAPHSFVCESISDEQHQEKCECGATHEAEKHTYENGVCTNEECRHEHETHAYKWVAEGTTHNHQCTVCEKIETSHTATPDTEAGLKHEDGDTHWYTCKGAEGCDLHVDETEHDEGTVFVEKDDTNHTVQCVCGKVIKETEGHTYDGYEQTADGTKHYQQCTKCEHKTEETLHEFNETTAKPTNDEEQGNHYWECECGAKKTGEHAYDPETHKCKCDKVDPDYTAATDAAAALDRLGLATDYYYDSELTATLTTSNGDATISWSEGSDYLDIAENTLTITLPTNIGLEATETATLTAKITAGEITLNREYTLTLHKGLAHEGTAEDPFTVEDVKVIFERLTTNSQYYEKDEKKQKIYVEGYVTALGTVNGTHGLNNVYIGMEMDSQQSDSVLGYNLNWGVLKEGNTVPSTNPLSLKDKVVIHGYLEYYDSKHQITFDFSTKDYPEFTYWLKYSERPEETLKKLPTITEIGEGQDVTFDLSNVTPFDSIEVECDNVHISVDDSQNPVFTLHGLKTTGEEKTTITVKLTYKEVIAEKAIEVTVTPFNYADHLSNALESIKKSIPEAILQGATSGEIKLDPKYSDVTLTITGGNAATIEVKMTSEGVYTLTAAQDASTDSPVEFTITLTYNGQYTGKGQTKTETVSVGILSADNPEAHILAAKEKLTAALAEAIPENKLEKEYYEITLPTIENIKFALSEVACDKIVDAKLVETEEGTVLTFEVIKAETEYPNVTFTFDVTYTKGESTSQNADFYFSISALKTVESTGKMIIIPGGDSDTNKPGQNEYKINLPIGTSYDNTTKLEHSANGITFETNKVQGANDGGQIIRFQKGTGFVQNTTQMPGNIKSIELVGLTSGTFKISLGTTKDCTDLIDQAFDAQNKYTTEETNYRFFKLTCTNSAQGIIQSFTINYATSVTEVSGRDKITAALAALEKVDDITEAKPEGVALPASTVEDVTFTWSTADAEAAYEVKDNKLIVPALPQSDDEINLVVTATCGTAKPQQKSFTVKVMGKETVAKQKIAEALQELGDHKFSNVTKAEDVELPQSTVDGVTFVWESDNVTYPAELVGDKYYLKVAELPAEETEVTLTLKPEYDGITDEAQNKTFKIMIEPEGSVAQAAWTLVTDISQLHAGAQVILVHNGYVNKGLNSSKHRLDACAITVGEAGIDTLPTEAQILTLGGEENHWTFAIDDQILYCNSTTSNNLYLTNDLSTNGTKWSISIQDGVATIKNEKGETYLQHNSTSTGIFSNYANGSQSNPNIYIKTET